MMMEDVMAEMIRELMGPPRLKARLATNRQSESLETHSLAVYDDIH
jgi:hypothetical protein